MASLSKFDQYTVDSVMEAISVLRCLNPDNIYKAECLACQMWQHIGESKHSSTGKIIKRLSEANHLPITAIGEASDGSTLYQIDQ